MPTCSAVRPAKDGGGDEEREGCGEG
jgi:hypothetical protein